MATQAAVASPTSPQVGWRARLGLRTQVLVALALVLLVAAIGANSYFSGLFSPAGAVSQYLAALGSGDASAAFAAMAVAPSTSPVDTSLTDGAALAAALKGSRPPISNVTIGATRFNGTTALVDVSYKLGAANRHDTLTVVQSGTRHLDLYPTWQVSIAPVLYQLTLTAAQGALSIDGHQVAIATDKAQTIAVLPLAHQLQTAGSAMVLPGTENKDSTLLGGSTTPITLPLKLTSAGLAATKKAVADTLGACAGRTELKPTGCPQASTATLVDEVKWQLVGDPTTDLAVGTGTAASLVGTGHFQMVLSDHPSYGSGTQHEAIGGPYSAALSVSPSDVKVNSIGLGTGVPAATRPAGATDQAAKDLVAAALAKCAAATTAQVNDCPQLTTLSIVDATNVRWTLSGDPLAGSTVTFDGDTSLLRVAGDFSMTIDFDMAGSHYQGASAAKRYEADLFWDGSALQLVTVQGVLA